MFGSIIFEVFVDRDERFQTADLDRAVGRQDRPVAVKSHDDLVIFREGSVDLGRIRLAHSVALARLYKSHAGEEFHRISFLELITRSIDPEHIGALMDLYLRRGIAFLGLADQYAVDFNMIADPRHLIRALAVCR